MIIEEAEDVPFHKNLILKTMHAHRILRKFRISIKESDNHKENSYEI